MKTVTKIEPTAPQMPERKKVAAYARVSMETERLQHSLSAQISYYSELIQKHPDWQYAGVYADAAAIIGLNQKPEANGRRFSPFSLVSAHFKANGGCNCLI